MYYLLFYVVYMRHTSLNFIEALQFYKHKSKVVLLNSAQPVVQITEKNQLT